MCWCLLSELPKGLLVCGHSQVVQQTYSDKGTLFVLEYFVWELWTIRGAEGYHWVPQWLRVPEYKVSMYIYIYIHISSYTYIYTYDVHTYIRSMHGNIYIYIYVYIHTIILQLLRMFPRYGRLAPGAAVAGFLRAAAAAAGSEGSCRARDELCPGSKIKDAGIDMDTRYRFRYKGSWVQNYATLKCHSHPSGRFAMMSMEGSRTRAYKKRWLWLSAGSIRVVCIMRAR